MIHRGRLRLILLHAREAFKKGPAVMFTSASLKPLLSCTVVALSSTALMAQPTMRFTCGAPGAGEQRLSAATLYKQAPGAFGFDLSTQPTSFQNDACSSEKPFFFSVAVPDGDYRVTLKLGGPEASTTTVRAESRRLFLLERVVKARQTSDETFIVHVRTPDILTGTAAPPGQPPPLQVKLKPREIGALDWDGKLTLEFNGEHPALRSISIAPAPEVPTVYLAGDSTVVDQDKEPWAAWGQMLPYFFGPRIAIANEAESGETIKSFIGERRYDKIMSTIKPGDLLMVQFAHNDQKPGAGYVPAATDYKMYLKRYIADARAHGATAILVTSMNRRNFDPAGHIVQTLGDYPEAMRQVAAEEHVALIDLNTMSKTLYEAMGEPGTLKAFVHYPANTFPGQTEELKDDTHFNAYGAYELSRCVVQSMRDQHLPLAAFLRKDIPNFDPAHPDPLATWHLPASPAISTETPYGR